MKLGSQPEKQRHHSVALDYAWYLLSNVSLVLAGMVSLPITARKLSKLQYGILGFFDPFSTVWIALLKFGFQHSIIRFYSLSFRKRNAFFSTLLWVPQVGSLVLTLVAIALLCATRLLFVIPNFWFILALLCWSQGEAWNSLFQTVLISERLSHVAAGYTSLLRWLTAIFGITTVTLISPTAAGLIWSRVCADLIAGVVVFRTIFKKNTPSISAFERPIFTEALRYGVPMSMTEMASVIHDQLDRIVLVVYLGYVELGVYHLNYSVAQYLGVLLATSFNPAFSPFANQIYDTFGPSEYCRRIKVMFRPLRYASAAILAGVFAFGPDVVRIMISREKARPDIFIIVAATYALMPMAGVLTYGLSLLKKAKTQLITLLASCVINLGANIFLIPRLGVVGAAWATAISFSALWLTRLALTPKETIPLESAMDFVKPAIVGLVTCGTVVVLQVRFNNVVLRLGTGGLVFAVVFCGLALSIDGEMRQQALTMACKLWRRLAGHSQFAEP